MNAFPHRAKDHVSHADTTPRGIDRLRGLIAKLRDPAAGCEWNRKQTVHSFAPFLVEETYEVLDAVDRGELADVRDELGDVLLVVTYLCTILGLSVDAIADTAADKMVRRHPNVFGALQSEVDDPARAWDRAKWKERERRRSPSGVPVAMPALTRTVKIQQIRRTRELADRSEVRKRLSQQLHQLDLVDSDQASQNQMDTALGATLYTLAELATCLNIDPEGALRRAGRRAELSEPVA